MIDVKVSLTIALPGSVMVSKETSLKNVKMPVLNGEGKHVWKKGKPLYKDVLMEDPKQHNLNTILLSDKRGRVYEKLHFYTRKCIPAQKTVNISVEAYKYFISSECPSSFRGSRKEWNAKSSSERLDWHMNNYATAMGGTLVSYHVYDD